VADDAPVALRWVSYEELYHLTICKTVVLWLGHLEPVGVDAELVGGCGAGTG